MKKIIAISLFMLIGFNASANDNAKRLVELMIKEEVIAFKDGDESFFGDLISTVTAS